jgi:multidrug efflux pump subunit AcrB
MFVSFTLTPALCAWWLKPEDAKADHSTTKSGGLYAEMDAVYGRMLHWSLHHRAVMMGIAGLVVASAVLLYPRVGKELVPDDDQGEFSVNVRLAARHELPTDRRIHRADREGSAGAARAQPRDGERRQRQRQLQHHDGAARGAEESRSRTS